MAERIEVELVDDIDGSPAQQTVTFALDGVTYEIDLNQRHAQQLRSAFAYYVERARSPEKPARGSKQREREERQNRQANRQLTEQIRGAAQRTWQQKKARDTEKSAERQPSDAQPAASQAAAAQPERESVESRREPVAEKSEPKKDSTAAIPVPQFSSAVD